MTELGLSTKPPVSVLFIDNYDSFTFNLVDDVKRRGAQVSVWRNSVDAEWALGEVLALPAPRLILFSPGPGRPEEAGCCQALITAALGRVPIFGVCLGMQALVQALGGTVGRSNEVVHGKSALVRHDDSAIFAGLPNPLVVGRYHSLVATDVPEELVVTARKDELVMAVRHQQHPAIGVQFHPESVLTADGGEMIERLLDWARGTDDGRNTVDRGEDTTHEDGRNDA